MTTTTTTTTATTTATATTSVTNITTPTDASHLRLFRQQRAIVTDCYYSRVLFTTGYYYWMLLPVPTTTDTRVDTYNCRYEYYCRIHFGLHSGA